MRVVVYWILASFLPEVLRRFLLCQTLVVRLLVVQILWQTDFKRSRDFLPLLTA